MAPNEMQKYEKFLVVIDCVVFGFFDSEVKTLLVQGIDDNNWTVMSDVVTQKTVEETAQCTLRRLPGLVASHLEHLKVYTDFDRYREKRVISATLCAIARFDCSAVSAIPVGYRWFAFHELPVINDRFSCLFLQAKKKLRETSADFFTMAPLLPPKFTLIQLQRIYESINEMRLDKGNFAKRVLSGNMLKRLDEKNINTSKKGSFYYQFDSEYLVSNAKLKDLNSY